MTKLTKLILIVAVLFLAAGLLITTGVINVGDTVAWYITLPLGAVLLGLFMICYMLEKESALFNQEHQSLQRDRVGQNDAGVALDERREWSAKT